MGRIREIDGLRGISIVIVLVGHSAMPYGPFPPLVVPFVNAGMGVDIFFTISGYVITSLLLHELTLRGRIDWGEFLLKRFTKLAPTLFLMLIATALVSIFRHSGCSAQDYIVSAFFLSEILNVHCWNLGHTWSLSVEELFYASWTPTLAFLSRKVAYRAMWLMIIAAPLIRCLNYATAARPELLPFRLIGIPFFGNADTIAFGAVAAFFVVSRKNRGAREPQPISRRWEGGIILGLILLTYFLSIPFHRMGALSAFKYVAMPFEMSVLGLAVGMLLAQIGVQRLGTGFSRGLSWAPLVLLGRISYSLYLWQEMVMSPSIHWHPIPAVDLALRLTIAVALGLASFYLFEKPVMAFLRRKLSLKSSELDTATQSQPESPHIIPTLKAS